MWTITKYKCDQTGKPYGKPFTSICYTPDLMESYKNPKFVEKIELMEGKTLTPIWTAKR